MLLAGPPERDVAVPQVVVDVARGRAVVPVWRNELGGLTFEVGAGDDRCFVKWAPAASGLDLVGEAQRMVWTRAFSPVPEVLASGEEPDGSWLVTTPLPGESAVSDRWKRAPDVAVAAIGAGLRHLHDHAPPQLCPFSWTVQDRVARAEQRAGTGLSQPGRWHAIHQRLTVPQALSLVRDPPPIDKPVVCHGDACAPNTILDQGAWSGHVDLGALGVADRWADLAVATWSTEWNYGANWEQRLLDAYGIEPDPERTRYYRLLWDLA